MVSPAPASRPGVPIETGLLLLHPQLPLQRATLPSLARGTGESCGTGGLSQRGWGGVGRRLDVAGGEVAGEECDALLEWVDGVPEKFVEAALARLTVGGVGGA